MQGLRVMRKMAGGWFTQGDGIAALRDRSGQPAVGPCLVPIDAADLQGDPTASEGPSRKI